MFVFKANGLLGREVFYKTRAFFVFFSQYITELILYVVLNTYEFDNEELSLIQWEE